MIPSSDVALVVVNFGSSQLLRTNLTATAAGLPGAHVVVVDNLSTPAERATLRELCGQRGWQSVEMATNAGFGTGMNAGVERARELGASWFLLLNPDLTIAGDDVRRLLDRAEDAQPGILAPRILRPDGTVWSVGTDLYLDDGSMRTAASPQGDASRRVRWLTGACLLVGVAVWDAIGGFADEYFLYWEDVELSYRASAAGAALLVVDDAVAVHAVGGTQGEGHDSAGSAKSTTYYYYNARNRLLFAARNLGDDDLRRWIGTARAAGLEILLRGGRRQLLTSPGGAAAVWRGTRAGVAEARRALSSRSSTGGSAAGSPPR